MAITASARGENYPVREPQLPTSSVVPSAQLNLPTNVIALGADRGLRVEVLPSRGLGVGFATFDGVPVSWGLGPGDTERVDDFPGGLVTTCGLHNVGTSSDGHRMHGEFFRTEASAVSVVKAPGRGREVTITGDVIDGELVCQRRVTFNAECDILIIRDTVVNYSNRPLQAPLLYHTNWGAPFFGELLEVNAAVAGTIARDVQSAPYADRWRYPARVDSLTGVVVEHVISSDAGVALTNKALRIVAEIRWSGLPRLHQWIRPRGARGPVLGIEPANCSTLGRQYDRAENRAPYLGPGERRATSLRISFRRIAGAQ